MVQIKRVSKHANFYPMLSEEALAELAADIKENGQQSPITVTADGVLLDGRNRLKACEIAGVEPRVTVYEGDDEGAFIRSSNERRHQSTGSRAMSTALSLQADGYRKNGRWKRGSVDNGESSNSGEFGAWQFAMKCAGRVLDELPELAQSVIDGEVALDDAYRQANVKLKARKAEEQRRIEEARDEQKREDSAGRYFDNHQEAKAWLDEKPQGAFPTMREAYAAYMEHSREAHVNPIQALVDLGHLTDGEILDHLDDDGKRLVTAAPDELVFHLAQDMLSVDQKLALVRNVMSRAEQSAEGVDATVFEFPNRQSARSDIPLDAVADHSPEEEEGDPSDYDA